MNTEARSEVPIPNRMRPLPVNRAGYIVPWFVASIDGVPDFRVIRPEAIRGAVMRDKCWVCGTKMSGPTATFVIGPMCAVNRVSAEPPSHADCARYSVQVCPFLVNPKKRRREGNKPEGSVNPAGDMISRNPGVSLLWSSRSWSAFRAPGGVDGVLFDVGDPTRVEWWAEGREATRAEILASIDSGLPILMASAEGDGPEAVAELNRLHQRALELVPA
jgi:hypothetical protein